MLELNTFIFFSLSLVKLIILLNLTERPIPYRFFSFRAYGNLVSTPRNNYTVRSMYTWLDYTHIQDNITTCDSPKFWVSKNSKSFSILIFTHFVTSGSLNFSTFPSLNALLINVYLSSVESVNELFNEGPDRNRFLFFYSFNPYY